MNRLLAAGAASFATVAGAPDAFASPYESTDAGVAEGFEVKGVFETESGRDESARAPALDLTWPLKPGVLEMSLSTGAAQIRRADEDAQSGLNDIEIAAKWRLRDGGDGALSLAIEPALVVPSADDGLGDGRWRYALPLIMQAEFGPMTYFANIGWSDSFVGGDGEVSVGVVAQRSINERLEIGVELAGAAPASNWRDGRLDANLGFTFKLTPKLELQGLVGRSVNGRADGPVTLTRIALEYGF